MENNPCNWMMKFCKLIRSEFNGKNEPARRIIRFNLFLLKFIGMRRDVYESTTTDKALVAIQIAPQAFFVAVSLMYVLTMAEKMSDAAEGLMPAVNLSFTMVMMGGLYAKRARVWLLVSKLQRDWEHDVLDATKPRMAVLMTNVKTQRFAIVYSLGKLALANLHALYPLIQMLCWTIDGRRVETLVLPDSFKYLVGRFSDGWTACFYALIVTNVNYGVLAMSGVECLFISLSMHVVAQLRVLRARVSRVRGALGALRACARRHCELLEYVDDLRDVFGLLLTIQYAASSMLLCLIVFKFSMITNDFIAQLPWLIYFTSLSVQFYVLAWCGQQIINENELLSQAAYNCPWYVFGPRFRKSLLLFMMMAQKPLGIGITRSFMLSIPTFEKIMRAAISYYTLLHNLSHKKN